MPDAIQCRVAACREKSSDDQTWSFYLINDGDVSLDSVTLQRVAHEWGDIGRSETPYAQTTGLAPHAHTLIWRDDGELRLDMTLILVAVGNVQHQTFEFPKLYRKTDLPVVDGLGKPGWCETAKSIFAKLR